MFAHTISFGVNIEVEHITSEFNKQNNEIIIIKLKRRRRRKKR